MPALDGRSAALGAGSAWDGGSCAGVVFGVHVGALQTRTKNAPSYESFATRRLSVNSNVETILPCERTLEPGAERR